MKSIILFRHAKSDWYADYDVDHDRPLADRGIIAATKMGRFLAKQHDIPDVVITSTAVRAKTTLDLAMSAGRWNCQVMLEPAMYGGSSKTLLQLAQQLGDALNCACLVGHEPGLSRFIDRTCNTGCVRFATASMASIAFKVSHWQDIRFGRGKLAWLQRPKDTV